MRRGTMKSSMTLSRASRGMLAALSLLAAACSADRTAGTEAAAPAAASGPPSELRAFTGAHTRVVWVQGDGTDPETEGDQPHPDGPRFRRRQGRAGDPGRASQHREAEAHLARRSHRVFQPHPPRPARNLRRQLGRHRFAEARRRIRDGAVAESRRRQRLGVRRHRQQDSTTSRRSRDFRSMRPASASWSGTRRSSAWKVSASRPTAGTPAACGRGPTPGSPT